jgi:hypothetical protein
LIGNDYDPIRYGREIDLKELVGEIDVWIVGPSEIMTGYSKLLKSNIPILNINYSRATPKTRDFFSAAEKELHLRPKKMYMLSIRPLDVVKMELDQYGFNVISVREIQPTFTYFPLQLIRVALK